MILLIDNYDSFVFNLARYFQRLGQETLVVRNDATTIDEIRNLDPQAIVISPGPCTPREAGVSLEVVERLWQSTPILGVCLGHQTIGAAFGGQVIRAPAPMHGRASLIHHAGHGVFAQAANPFPACRYHSLIVDAKTLPACLEPTAFSDDGVLMGLQHRDALVVGVQFHPESILTDSGYRILGNFLKMCGAIPAEPQEHFHDELVPPRQSAGDLPAAPITF
jgi:anthranilate synthase/aminodeoxychorismate synthase-like glutamine amidotransferase